MLPAYGVSALRIVSPRSAKRIGNITRVITRVSKVPGQPPASSQVTVSVITDPSDPSGANRCSWRHERTNPGAVVSTRIRGDSTCNHRPSHLASFPSRRAVTTKIPPGSAEPPSTRAPRNGGISVSRFRGSATNANAAWSPTGRFTEKEKVEVLTFAITLDATAKNAFFHVPTSDSQDSFFAVAKFPMRH